MGPYSLQLASRVPPPNIRRNVGSLDLWIGMPGCPQFGFEG